MVWLEQHEIKNEILRILSEYRMGTLTTMKGDQPYSRFMIFRNEGFLLHTISSKNTEKVEDILKNPKVHILFGFEGGGYGKPYLEITAIATIHDEKEMKEHFWHDNFLKYISGPDDPNYIVIRCEPKTIRLMRHPDLDGPYTLSL